MTSLGDVGAGNTLGRYELLTPIAQGGMALVWAARLKGTRGFQKIVAVKTMLPALTEDPQFEQMFLAEAELASRIRHQNVCEILDLGEEDDTLYIVMEWVNGEPLTALLRASQTKGGIPLSVATKLTRDAAFGLHAAHEVKNEEGELVGLVHRDVSPHNILVGFDGAVKIVDFGIAKATTAAEGGKTQAGQMKGKVPYMAPEQARGGAVDRRTDIFALGIVLYQLATGKHPFRGEDDIATLKRIVDRAPIHRASTIVKSLPPSLDNAIARALEKDPARRFQTMTEFAEALDKVRSVLAANGNDVDVSTFVKGLLGERAEKRKRAIKDAIRSADDRARERTQTNLIIQGDVVMEGPGSIPSGASQLTPSSRDLLSLGAISQVSQTSGAFLTGSQNTGISRPDLSLADSSLPSIQTSNSLVQSDAGVSTDAPISSSAPKKKRAPLIALGAVGAVALAIGVGVFAIGKSPAEPSQAATPPAPSTQVAASASAPATTQAATTPSAAPTDGAKAEVTASVAAEPAASVEPKARGQLPQPGGTVRRQVPTATAAATTPSGPALPKVRDPGF